MIEVLKNINHQKKFINSIIGHKNREFCLIFVEIILYIHIHTITNGKKNKNILQFKKKKKNGNSDKR